MRVWSEPPADDPPPRPHQHPRPQRSAPIHGTLGVRMPRAEDLAVVTLVGISGSLRRGSYNSALLRAAEGLLPAGVTLGIATIRGIPLYDGDAEAADGIPAQVAALKEAIAAADGVLIATPE